MALCQFMESYIVLLYYTGVHGRSQAQVKEEGWWRGGDTATLKNR